MHQLPDALAPFAQFAQFILWRLAPDGKNKLPIDYRTGRKTSKGLGAHDPAIWLPADLAFQWAAHWGPDYGVAFVFTENDPFFFLDIDDCRDPDTGEYSETAWEMLRWFDGAAVEVSQSGRGLHVFGVGTCPPHCCKHVGLGLELYTNARFVALTGTGAIGRADFDCSASLGQMVPYYFPKKQPGTIDDWTTEPVSQWRGLADDDELLRRALASRSAASVFGDTASFAQLWTADAEALGRAFPDSQGRAYDASSADLALAQHLAFWTGSDCDRMLRLMQRSELARDKWAREDYLHRTILKAAQMQTRFYGEAQAQAEAARPEGCSALRGSTPAQRAKAEAIRAATFAQLEDANDRETLANAPPAQQAQFWTANEGKPIAELVTAVTPTTAAPAPVVSPTRVAGYQFLPADAQLQFFAGCVYVQSLHRALVPSGALLKPEQFNATYGGYVFQLDDLGRTTRKAWEAFTESQCVRWPKAERPVFQPLRPPGEIADEYGVRTVNTYVPAQVPRMVGDYSPFLDVLRRVLPDKRDQTILLAYMAACVQHKGVKFQWAPLLQGVEGNGKTLFTRCVAAAIGRQYRHYPSAKDLDNRFNSWLYGKLFIGVEDVYVPEAKREVLEVLKPMITGGDGIEIQGKGVDQYTAEVCANFLFNSNHRDAISKTRNDRRFCVFFTAQQQHADLARDGLDGDYFPRIYNWLRGDGYAIVSELLHTYPIPDEFNPATSCHRAPDTSTTGAALAASLGLAEQEILEAVGEGRPGFAGGWIASHALKDLLTSIRRSIPPRRYRETLAALGYDWHPALPDGRLHNPLPGGGGRVRLFIRQGHADAALKFPADIVAAYSKAQEQAAVAAAFPAPVPG
jgi:primase-polymerase (primpol)-like protein